MQPENTKKLRHSLNKCDASSGLGELENVPKHKTDNEIRGHLSALSNHNIRAAFELIANRAGEIQKNTDASVPEQIIALSDVLNTTVEAIANLSANNPGAAQSIDIDQLQQQIDALKASNTGAIRKYFEEKWAAEQKLTKAEGRRNPARFILDEMALGLEQGMLRANLPEFGGSRLANAYNAWLRRRKASDPEQPIWSDTSIKTRNHREKLAQMPPDKRAERNRKLNQQKQARYWARLTGNN